MISGGMNPIKYKINCNFDEKSRKEYIVIIGGSNSIMTNGWAFHFTEKMRCYNIINFSLGATCSTYIAFVFLMHRKVLAGAKYIIVEPFVNDVSFFGNRDISPQALLTAMSYYYNIDGNLINKTLVLILPTLKRIKNIAFNAVYKAHLDMAFSSNAIVLDCHPFFLSLDESAIGQAFDDPAHLNSKYAHAIADWIANFLIKKSVWISSDICLSRNTPELVYVDVLSTDNLIEKSTSLFSCKVHDLKNSIYLDVSPEFSLIGILHWSDMNLNNFKINSCGSINYGLLKSKFLKLSSFSFHIQGPFLFSNQDLHSFGVAGFLFSKRVIQEFLFNENDCFGLHKGEGRIYSVLL